MMMHRAAAVRGVVLAGMLLLAASAPPAGAMENAPAYYAKWSNGVSSDPAYFPIAVWLQSPSNATAYKNNAGINLFVGLWAGPTDAQLSTLQSAGVRTLCDQNATGLAHAADKTIAGWTHDDEPDNAQSDGSGGYGPPILPSVVISKYNTLKGQDATRPIYLNLGQGVAWDGWYGRGTRTNHPEDYPEYVKGCDIASYDIYPVNSADAAVSGNLWYVAQGIDRLRSAVGDAKPVWCWIECTKIDANAPAKPTPAQVRSEVWMALIHGANGIGYFCHSWTPSFDEAALLHDTTMAAAVKSLNDQIQSLAAVLNGPTIKGEVSVGSSNAAVPVDLLVKRSGGATYVFAAAMRNGSTTATFTVLTGTSAEVLGEGRSIAIGGGTFSDGFGAYGVHLYRIAGSTPPSVPAAPSSLVAAATSSSQINLGWTDNATNETGFKIERKTGIGGTWGLIATVGADVTAYSNTGLAAGTTYYYRLRATNAAGDSASSNEASATTPAVAALMTVSPAGGWAATGSAGGPFAPSSQAYTVTNTGTAAMVWAARKQAGWVGVSPAGGTLAAGASATVTVSINAAEANVLPGAAAPYTDVVFFANATNGSGSTGRPVSLDVTGSWEMAVTPTYALAVTGKTGGPFSPASIDFTVSNAGSGTIQWTAGDTAGWAGVSPTGGTLAAGASATVTVSITPAAANLLGAGTYGDTVTFTNATNGSGTAKRWVSLTASANAPPMLTIAGPPTSTSVSPLGVGGTVTDDGSVAGVVWVNGTTGEAGAAAVTGSAWEAQVPVDAGENTITVTAVDNGGTMSSETFTVDYAPAAGGGGGGHGKCGSFGLDLMAPLALVWLARRRRARR
jgi:hypothetical protein